MLINIKYDVGDSIKWIKKIPTDDSIQVKVKCSFCNGSGKIQGHDNSVLNCPNCKGEGTILTWDKMEDYEMIGIINYFDVKYNSQSKQYTNGPIITYYTTQGEVRQSDVVSRV